MSNLILFLLLAKSQGNEIRGQIFKFCLQNMFYDLTAFYWCRVKQMNDFLQSKSKKNSKNCEAQSEVFLTTTRHIS